MYSAVGTLYISKIPFSPKVTKTILSAFLTFQKFDGFKNIGKGHLWNFSKTITCSVK